ncbi:NADP-dependent oxidoreductase domain-containing protein [Suillus variegatus]|nr:NADP-dependent oxidoreductase domain-containing protein [Suillus variegatus]
MSMPRKVPYTRLGNSGLQSYGKQGWQDWVLGEDEALEHIKAQYEAGFKLLILPIHIRNGYSEVILGRVFNVVGREYNTHQLGGRKDPDQNGSIDLSETAKQHIFASVKKSLERLQMDYIDVLQCIFDNETPIEETMQALHDVVQAGYVRYIGMSSCWAYHVNYAITNKLTPSHLMQITIAYSIARRARDMFGVGSIPWSPLARGALTRPLGQQTSKVKLIGKFIGNYAQASSYETIVNRVEELAKKKGVTMAQIAIAWILTKDGEVSAPIVGTTSIANLKDIIAGIDVKLTVEEIKFLEEEYKPTAVIGHF